MIAWVPIFHCGDIRSARAPDDSCNAASRSLVNKDATYVPPPHDEVNALMGDLESFLHNVSINVPTLIRIAIGHYQFETIHPFLDGNGRIGRLLITLYLLSKGLLTLPTLYLSDYFDRNRLAYYDRLSLVREKNDIVQWINFFLTAISETCDKGILTFGKIQKLRGM